MILQIEDIFPADQLARLRQLLDAANWQDGRHTAGAQAATVKSNLQLAEDDPLAIELGNHIIATLARHPLFVSAALPLRFFPPMFNRYANGGHYGLHVDNAIRYPLGSRDTVRSDLSCTLFLRDPEDYDGGELEIEDRYGCQQVKLPAGHLVLYPSTSLHQVTPVSRGSRLCAFFWIQSMVRDNSQREMLFDLDQSIQALTQRHGHGDAEVSRLTGIYHNLLRQWAET